MTQALAYDDSGAGTPVVLLHAFPVHAAMWQAQRLFIYRTIQTQHLRKLPRF